MQRINLKIILTTLLIIIIIGIFIPLFFSLVQNDDSIPLEMRVEARLSIPKLFRLITIYQSFSEQEDGTIIAGTHTLFNIKLQEIIFTPMDESTGNIGSFKIKYPPFSK